MKKKSIIGIAVIAALAAVIIIVALVMNADKPYDYDLSEYVKVGKYKGLEYTKPEIEITDADVDKEIQGRLMQKSKPDIITKGTVKKGDTISIAYKGTIDGKEFEGGSSDSQELVLGSGSMIEGFEEGLEGKKIGDKVTLDLKFPEDYHSKEVAGKDVKFVVTIKAKTEMKVPELNADFVKKNSDQKTVKEYKAAVKKEMKKNMDRNIDMSVKQQLWEEILSNSKAKKYPEKELKAAKEKANEMEKQYKDQAKQYGMEWDEFLKTAMNTDEKGFKKMKEDYAKQIVLNEMVVYSIARDEDIKLSKKERNEKLDEMLEESGMTKDAFKKQFGMSIEDYSKENNWDMTMLMDKVLDKVMKLGKCKVEKVDPAAQETPEIKSEDLEEAPAAE